MVDSLRYIADAKTACSRMQRLIEKKSIKKYKIGHQDNPTQLEVYFKGRKYQPQFIRNESFREGKPALIGGRKLEERAENIHPQIALANLATFWSHDSNRPAIQNATLNSTKGELVGITGQVGSGKTSLLMGILGELPVSGHVSFTGKMAYVAQTPWVFSGTVRENITFGMPFDEEKFNKIIEVCDLGKDIDRFPKRDQTEIGQRGVILSGGQRARVSLARAIYSDADIYLLDDPLSAVDAKVGKHLFDRCIKEFLDGRVRILVTHHLQFLKHTDNIVMLHSGSVFYQGTYSAMLKEKRRGFSFLSQGSQYLKDEPQEDDIDTYLNEIEKIHRKSASEAEKNRGRVDLRDEEEDRLAGSVKWWLYWKYFRAALSVGLIVSLVFLFAIVQGNQRFV